MGGYRKGRGALRRQALDSPQAENWDHQSMDMGRGMLDDLHFRGQSRQPQVVDSSWPVVQPPFSLLPVLLWFSLQDPS